MSFGSFQKGIHRSRVQRGPAALTLTTSLKDPYGDAYDESGALFTYAYRAGALDQADNRALRAAFELHTPLVYFRAMAPGQYLVVAPMFVTADDPARARCCSSLDSPSRTCSRAASSRRRTYARTPRARRGCGCTSSASSSTSCAPTGTGARSARCASARSSRPPTSCPDVEPEGIAAVVNGLALCAIHHLAFDRNLLGIDPEGVVHIAERLLREIDGPMLRTGLQGFHGARIALPRRPEDRPDPHRLSAVRPLPARRDVSRNWRARVRARHNMLKKRTEGPGLNPPVEVIAGYWRPKPRG